MRRVLALALLVGMVSLLVSSIVVAASTDKITICHHSTANPHTITVSRNAWPAHQKHGDYEGECRTGDTVIAPGISPQVTNPDGGTIYLPASQKLPNVGADGL